MQYTVLASPVVNVRQRPSARSAVVTTIPFGQLVTADGLHHDEQHARTIGYDDPATPEPARVSYLWAHTTAPVVGYVSMAWLQLYTPRAPLTIRSEPRISFDRFQRLLDGSPALPEARACYDTCVQAGLDPAVALAFFLHESSMGREGVAARFKNWGNLRRGRRGQVRQTSGGPFVAYPTWVAGLADWCDLINGRIYAGAGRVTVDQVVPVYAPSSDHNRPAHYIAAVTAAVEEWTRYDAHP